MLTLWGHSKSAQLGGNPTPGNWLLGGGQRLMERANPGVIHADLKACNEYVAGLEHAAAVRCPALLILGERDMLTPARSATRLAEALPEAETVILKGCGHAMLAEQPNAVLDQLIRVV
jgi:pimeloyl-ACP methyl ester carboxylesterase